jgi:hypothetical protein
LVTHLMQADDHESLALSGATRRRERGRATDSRIEPAGRKGTGGAGRQVYVLKGRCKGKDFPNTVEDLAFTWFGVAARFGRAMIRALGCYNAAVTDSGRLVKMTDYYPPVLSLHEDVVGLINNGVSAKAARLPSYPLPGDDYDSDQNRHVANCPLLGAPTVRI